MAPPTPQPPPSDEVLRKVQEEHARQLQHMEQQRLQMEQQKLQMEQFQVQQAQQLEYASQKLAEQQAEIEAAARNHQQQQVQVSQFASQMSEGLNRQFADMKSQLENHLLQQEGPRDEVRRKARAIDNVEAMPQGRYVQEAIVVEQAQAPPPPAAHWQPTLPPHSMSSAASNASWQEVEQHQPQPSHFSIATPAIENRQILPDADSDLDEGLLTTDAGGQ